jgi:putative proteasome-type protease
MTYCVALRLRSGLVMLADTRTNAGVDHISTFGKLHVFEAAGERAICLMSAGNLALTQAVVNRLTEGFQAGEGAQESLYTVKSMFRAAQLAGEAVRDVTRLDAEALKAQGVAFDISLLLGGQIKNGRQRLFQIYSAGNFIEATEDTPYLQIGEHKYGKPILDRACRYDTELYDGIKLVLVSMDSTLRSNLTVGLPIDLFVCRKDALRHDILRRIGEADPYFQMISRRWSEALRDAYRAIPRPDWADASAVD